MAAYLEWSLTHTVMTVIVYAVGYALWRSIGAGSEARRVHGWYVLLWSGGGFYVGGVLGPLVPTADSHDGMVGVAGFCLLIGWAAGTVHGAIMLLLSQRTSTRAVPTEDEE